MNDEQRWQRNPDVSWRMVEGEAILINPVKGRTLVLNGTGASLWSWLDNSTPGSLATKLSKEFEVESSQAEKDVDAFLAELKREDLIQSA